LHSPHPGPLPKGETEQRKAWDLNPHDLAVARFSKPARPAVSGYLPNVRHVVGRISNPSGQRRTDWKSVLQPEWTHRGSNPDFQSAELVSSRWTMSPVLNAECGIRNAEGMNRRACTHQFRMPNSPFCISSDPGWIRTIALLAVAQASWPLDHGTGWECGIAPMSF
jgi:hypothetical protein